MAKTCCGGSKVAVRHVKQSSCCGGTQPSATVPAPCCGGQNTEESSQIKQAPDESRFEARWVIGRISSPVGDVPRIATSLSFRDTLGSWKCRWSIGRMNYKIDPGLYAVGAPTADSPVLVTSNYKMTFDRLREQLDGSNLWIVVLDTDGVNVWCAAGKGTFGTDEVIHRINEVKLSCVVSHRTLILPQLGAVGVAAHEVLKASGFRVTYGPIRAKDIQEYFANGMQVTEEMRTVKFPIGDRAVLTPMELVGASVPLLVAFGVLFILNVIGFGHYGWIDFYGIIGAVFVGAVVTPILLPWVPGRAFSLKGGLLGLIWAVGFLLMNGLPSAPV
ncbi:MAG TPA: mercury methylation corrinoid protein HgcA, partial [Negativicutes bacterium]|nr:mercury methylation corrinoid protein HgcA [Negativicutes bacterium]